MIGAGVKEGKGVGYLGIRPAYHSLEDSNYGFLRGTQIEFLNVELSYSKNKVEVENATILSIASLAQRSYFFENLSWRTKFGWDKNSLDSSANFIGTVGLGLSWGSELGYSYIMTDPLFYIDDGFKSAIGASAGFVFDKYSYMSTKVELTRRYYDVGETQNLFELSQSFRLSQNIQLRVDYDYKQRDSRAKEKQERSLKCYFNYYF